MDDTFGARLKFALTGSAQTPLVYLGNFEVEEAWGSGETGLPRIAFAGSAAVVNRLDELTLTLAGPGDHVVLKQRPDEAYAAYLGALGLNLPRVLAPARSDPGRTVTEDALADPALIAELAAVAARGGRLLPHGVSEREERLARAARLPLAAPPAAVCKRVNSKVYSRRAAAEHGLPQVGGWACDSLAELEEAVAGARALLAAGRSVVIKDAFGVSGKGLVVIEGERRLEPLLRKITSRARKADDARVALVVEEWVARRADLNYQFTLARDGAVRFDFVKEASTENGVHKGHRMPARLPAGQVRELEAAARALGGRLAADGYYGVVGVDAMVGADGTLYPVVEINARSNMSTYQMTLQERFAGEGTVALARHYPLRLRGRLPFEALRDWLGGLLYDRGEGLLICNFATVNAAVREGASGPFDGRLYALLVAGSDGRLRDLDHDVTRALGGIDER